MAPGDSRATLSAITRAAATGTSAPVSDNSPASTRPASNGSGAVSTAAPAVAAPSPGGANCPAASSRPTAIGRSKRPDSLGISAGDRLTVMRPAGKLKPLLMMAARTRSRLSRTSVSGRPTTLKLGRPGPRWVSTRTAWACRPLRVRLAITASVKAVSDNNRRRVWRKQKRPRRRPWQKGPARITYPGRTAATPAARRWRPVGRRGRACAPADRPAHRIPRA
ncbi:Uncharacterised protein [Achromobacter sp. 2789STDY5608615]|nr:Uncharacterised protein [Achromobacter sp. 2789STDY5608615]